MDMTTTIAPRSDQMNAEDLLAGPRTFTITEVREGSSAEQPVSVYLAEFPKDRPFKPSKTVRRIMVHAWGNDSAGYVGKRLTLYRDPLVKFGGDSVGGIRVSHMSGIPKRFSLALTITRGKRAPYVIEPLPDVPPPATADTMRLLVAAFEAAGVNSKAQRLDYCRHLTGRALASAGDLTQDEAQAVIAALQTDAGESRPDVEAAASPPLASEGVGLPEPDSPASPEESLPWVEES